MFLLKQILPAAVMAMMVAAGVCGFALCWGKERARGALGPLAIGLAYLSGHLVITGWVPFPPTDTTNWLPYFALAARCWAHSFLPLLSFRRDELLLVLDVKNHVPPRQKSEEQEYQTGH